MVRRTDCKHYDEIFSKESTPHYNSRGRPTCKIGKMLDECPEDHEETCFESK